MERLANSNWSNVLQFLEKFESQTTSLYSEIATTLRISEHEVEHRMKRIAALGRSKDKGKVSASIEVLKFKSSLIPTKYCLEDISCRYK